MKYAYIPTRTKRELVKFDVDCNWKRLSRLPEKEWWPFILVDKLFLVSST